jgi:hypothetical protein
MAFSLQWQQHYNLINISRFHILKRQSFYHRTITHRHQKIKTLKYRIRKDNLLQSLIPSYASLHEIQFIV